ncbi:MAG: FtsQ-type POTRA domain-containing protein [Gammaproteobacteria bacterium]
MSAQASVISSRDIASVKLRKVIDYLKYAPYLVAVIIFLWLSNALVQKVQDPSFMPVNKIRIKGEMKYVTEAMLQKSVTGLLGGGFFSTDVEKIQRAVEALPWVERASVRRVWPETLFIQVIEQQPMAKWEPEGFINVHGELFTPEVETKVNILPIWSGPKGSEFILYKKYNDFKQMLAEIGLSINKVNMDKRHAVRLEINNGIELVLGRKEQLLRLQNFIDVYKKILAGKMSNINSVDLRYSNGMSIRWKVAPQGKQ